MMSGEYEAKWREEIRANADRRHAYELEMLEELARVKALLATRGIVERKADEEFDRIVSVDNRYDYFSTIKSTCFKVPDSIDLERVVRWILDSTRYSECTVFLNGHNPTTVRCDADVKYFFK